MKMKESDQFNLVNHLKLSVIRIESFGVINAYFLCYNERSI